MAKSRFDNKYVASCHYRHPELGEVAVKVLSTAKRFSARWKSADLVAVTVPPRVTVAEYERAMDAMTPRLLARRPASTDLRPGWTYHTPEVDFLLLRGTQTGRFSGRTNFAEKRINLYIPADYNTSMEPMLKLWLNSVLKHYAERHAEDILIPHAQTIARILGVNPTKIRISHGQKVLGRCNSRGEILLSRNLVFYPLELRHLVIAHEYAHLTHLDHSAAFYALLDNYLDGQHAALKKQLRTHKLPFA